MKLYYFGFKILSGYSKGSMFLILILTADGLTLSLTESFEHNAVFSTASFICTHHIYIYICIFWCWGASVCTPPRILCACIRFVDSRNTSDTHMTIPLLHCLVQMDQCFRLAGLAWLDATLIYMYIYLYLDGLCVMYCTLFVEC